MILYQPNWFTKIVFSWKLWVPWSWFWRQNDRKTILYNPPFDGSVHRARFHNFISSFIKEGCFLAVFVVEFPGFLVQMVAWGLKIACKKFEEMFTKIDICLQKMVKWFFYHILLVSEQRRRSSSWCCNWMKCSCGWSLLNSASQLLEELESWTMRLADFV